MSIKNLNLTADIALKLIIEKHEVSRNIYHKRIQLMLQHFENKITVLVGGIKMIDTIDTVASMTNKVMKNMTSFIRTSKCKNNYSSNQLL